MRCFIRSISSFSTIDSAAIFKRTSRCVFAIVGTMSEGLPASLTSDVDLGLISTLSLAPDEDGQTAAENGKTRTNKNKNSSRNSSMNSDRVQVERSQKNRKEKTSLKAAQNASEREQEQHGPPSLCSICNASFTSKNKLFLHLESHGFIDSTHSRKLRRIVILIGWTVPLDAYGNNGQSSAADLYRSGVKLTSLGNAIVETNSVEKALFAAINAVDNAVDHPDLLPADIRYAKPKGYTRSCRSSSVSSFVLGIEPTAHGLCDTISFQGKRHHSKSKEPLLGQEEGQVQGQVAVEDGSEAAEVSREWVALVNALLPDYIRVLYRTVCPSAAFELNADLSTTQRLCEYMMPLALVVPPDHATQLPTDDEVRGEMERKGVHVPRKPSNPSEELSKMDRAFPRDGPEGQARINFFCQLKKVMRHICEGGRGNHTGRNCQSFHNFSTEGTIPDEAMSKRKVDRLFHKDLMLFEKPDGSNETWVCFSVSGDNFLHGQVRKMIGLTLAVMRGWLPEEFIIDALSSNYILHIPEVPAYALFLSECKYSYFEAKFETFRLDPRRIPLGQDIQLASIQPDLAAIAAWRTKIQRHIFELSQQFDDQWIDLFQKKCQESLVNWQAIKVLKSRDIPTLFTSSFSQVGEGGKLTSSYVPEAYRRVLELLREADHSGLWPASSTTRQKVILDSTLAENGGQGGTFSVGALPKHLQQPKGNLLFKDLTKACFELERVLLPNRPPSGTIAVNRHAQFKTHRDSGIANGQSSSMIVALGDFVGGDIVVEDIAHDIRYSPLEFDGWSQRHSTLPFQGERYTLVYFTPQGVTNEDYFWWKNS